jgi:hypothetical protein
LRQTIVEVLVTIPRERPFRQRDGRNTGAGTRVALETAVAASGDTGSRTIRVGEVTSCATPDATSLPVVTNIKRERGASVGSPASPLAGDRAARIAVGE